MRIVTLLAALVAVLAASTPARGQSLEASGFTAYVPSVSLENQASELNDLKIDGGFKWGLQAGWLFKPRWGVEALWTQQTSPLTLVTDAGAGDLFTMTLRQLHGNLVYHFAPPDARLRPYVFGGLGATFFTADDLESETKFSYGLGAGIKYFLWNPVGIRAHFRYKPTALNDKDAGRFCDPFGFCQGLLQQVEFAVGAVIRFTP